MSSSENEKKVQEQKEAYAKITDNGSKSGKAIFGWSILDWAFNPYFILVNIFVFAPYFSASIIGDPTQGQATWGYIQAIAGISIALLSPFFGSLADAAGPRKPGILVFMLLASLGMFSLWYVVPGADDALLRTVIGVVIAATCVEFTIVYHNAMLPSVVSQKRLGLVSGLGYASGYVGAIFVFVLWLSLFGFVDIPAFGIDKDAHEHNRLVGPLAGFWFILFSLPFFFLTPDQPRTGISRLAAAKKGIAMVIGTFRKLPLYKNIATYLLARMIYFDGQSAVFAFTGVYAVGVFGWPTEQIGIYGLLIILVQVPSSFIGGWIDDRIGSKRTIMGSLFLFGLGLVGLIGVTETRAAFLIPVSMVPIEPLTYVGELLNRTGFDTSAERFYLGLGIFTGTFAGPSLASSRTMLARIAPPSMIAEFYGLYALCGKATSFMAPLTVAIITQATDSARAGLASIMVFITIGLFLMIYVREESPETPHTEQGEKT